jgi:hypothetical protein
MKKKTEELIGWEIKRSGLEQAQNPVIVVFSWVEPNWKKDADNIAFAKKFILDALVSQKILKNDSRKNHVAGFFDMFPPPNKKGAFIVVDLLEITGAKSQIQTYQAGLEYLFKQASAAV